MKFRIYQVYHLLAALLLAVCMFNPIVSLVESNGAPLQLTNFKVLLPGGGVSYTPCALGIILIFTAVTMLFALFVSLYTNFNLQKRVAILNMLLVAGYYILLAVIVWILQGGMGFTPTLFAGFPLVALLLELMAFWATRQAEAQALKKTMDFRLRK